MCGVDTPVKSRRYQMFLIFTLIKLNIIYLNEKEYFTLFFRLKQEVVRYKILLLKIMTEIGNNENSSSSLDQPDGLVEEAIILTNTLFPDKNTKQSEGNKNW